MASPFVDKIGAIIHAGGSGSRYKSSTPKQFRSIDGKLILQYSIDLMRKALSEMIIVTVPPEWRKFCEDNFSREEYPDVHFIEADISRQHSSYKALQEFSKSFKYIIIHDAARPFADFEVLDECLAQIILYDYDCAESAINPPDTVARIHGDEIIEIPKRNKLKLTHTPQVFVREKLLEAYRHHESHLDDFTCDISVAVAHGLKCKWVQGNIMGYKITYPYDMAVLETLRYYSEAEILPLDWLSGKSVLLFGSTGGIGKDVLRILRENGADVYIPTREEANLSEDKLPAWVFAYTYDAIINCAGVMYEDDWKDEKNFDEIFNVHVRSCINIVKLAMTNVRGGGSIVFVGSSAALSPRSKIALYSAAKAAVVNFTRSAAEMLAPMKIRVNCVSPARTKTRMMQTIGLYNTPCLSPTYVARVIAGYTCVDHTGRTVNIRAGEDEKWAKEE